jgi:hypothetical protein
MAAAAPDDRNRFPNYPKSTLAGILLVLLLVLISARTMLTSSPIPGPDITDHERRFAPLRNGLPRRGTIGYVSDTDSPGEYFITQYVLAPVVVDAHPNGSLIVGNFNSPATIPGVLAKNRLVIKHDFGGGVLLLEPERR